MLASALETMSLREIGPQSNLPIVGAKVVSEIISTFAHFYFFFRRLRESCRE